MISFSPTTYNPPIKDEQLLNLGGLSKPEQQSKIMKQKNVAELTGKNWEK